MKNFIVLFFIFSLCFGAYIPPEHEKKVIWVNSVTSNVMGHRVYCCDTGTIFDENFNYENCPYMSVPVASPNPSKYTLPGWFKHLIEDTEYICNVAAEDTLGLISNFEDTIGKTYFFDQAPPVPATSVQIINP